MLRSELAAIAAAFAATFLASGPALGGQVTSFEPSTLVTALQEAGYKAKIEKDSGGDPRIETGSNGHTIVISFAGCNKNSDCDQIEFVAIWNCSTSLKECSDLSAKWNSEENYAHATMTKESVAIYYHLFMDRRTSPVC